MSRYLVGIDLGTTNTVVAYADLSRVPLPDPQRDPDAAPLPPPVAPEVHVFAVEQLVAPGEVEARSLLPSARYHPADGELAPSDTTLPWHAAHAADVPDGVVGRLALSLGGKTPGRLVQSAKSWLSHDKVDRTAPVLPWGAGDEVAKISPVAASASYLAHLRAAWDARFPHQPLASQEVVLTVPASFDEAARALTVQAAQRAGLPRVRLLEEPQAAFYDWLARHATEVETALRDVRLVAVVDVGGGTTDLTLIQVELRESGPRLTRIAVGEHLMLGGDNMDLAIARHVESRLAPGGQLSAARLSQLLAQSREAKERLLSAGAPERVAVTLLGTGSKLVGGTKSVELTRAELEPLVVDGFFPEVALDAQPVKRRGGIVEFGLPYVADAGITRHLAQFLTAHAQVAREALGLPDAPPVPDAVLLNGGVFHGAPLVQRLLSTLGGWRGAPVLRLDNDAPDLAVARGAVAYGLARRGVGLRIGGGSARSYHVVVDRTEPRKAVCVLPRGSEEGEEVQLTSRTFSLRAGEPVRFELVTSTADRAYRAGDLVEVDHAFAELPPIAAVLDAGLKQKREIPVRLAAGLTEVGTLELSCIAEDDGRRWKLELALRGESASAPVGTIGRLHPRFAEAVERVHRVFGKSTAEADARDAKTLRADLEKILGPRETWETPLLRELFGALLAGAKRRRRSADHERLWFNLVGYCLRPGFGYPLDDWRCQQLTDVWTQGVQFLPEAQVWAEFWILWRRIAGGLDEGMQSQLLASLDWYLEPPKARPTPRPKGPKMLGYDDMVRLAGSLERVDPARKTQVGEWLVTRLEKHDERPSSWWAVGRIGARVPFHGSAHQVVPREVAAAWTTKLLALEWSKVEWAKVEPIAFAAAQLARVSGDRTRDLDAALRETVAARLEKSAAPPAWSQMVREQIVLEAADERRVFGESLPPGLSLLG